MTCGEFPAIGGQGIFLTRAGILLAGGQVNFFAGQGIQGTPLAGWFRVELSWSNLRFAAPEIDAAVTSGKPPGNRSSVLSIFALPMSPSSSITPAAIFEGRPQSSAVCMK